MTTVLGISAFYHDSAAAIVVDGVIAGAVQEERFTRIKHDSAFPLNAVNYCLKAAGKSLRDIDYVVFYDKPSLKFDRLFETFLAFAPSGFTQFSKSLPVWVKEKLFLRSTIKKALAGAEKAKFVFCEHHESHAASAFFPSPFKEAVVLTMDGVGEWATTSFGIGRGNQLSLEGQINFPHSLGLLYSAFTYHCGFKVNSGEYKLMGLAPYGKPVYRDLILKHLIQLNSDGSYWLDQSYFSYSQGLKMTNAKFAQLFGPARKPESKLEQKHMDMAASIQSVTEDAVLKISQFVFEKYKVPNLVLAGGVALNCVANGKLMREGPFQNIWIQPASGDAGGSLGAALYCWYQLLGNKRSASDGNDMQKGSFLGPEYSDQEIETYLNQRGISFARCSTESELFTKVAEALTEQKVVGWFQGRMEFGPRALGARSIIGDPRSPAMQSKMNLKVKYRESFRPFAPMVLNEEKSKWFVMQENHENPYMLITAQVKSEHLLAQTEAERKEQESSPDLIKRVNVPRSTIPAVTHVDFSARVQTIGKEANPRVTGLMKRFQELTGCPVLVNTSFNVRGEPIVCSLEDALRCFAATEMDLLVLGNCLIDASVKDGILGQAERSQHINNFELD